MQLRIAHIDAERRFSGGEVQVRLLMTGLAERGHDGVLICPPRSVMAKAAARRGETVCAVPMRGDADAVAVWRLARRLRRMPVDLVHLHTGRAAWLGGAAAWLAQRPALVTRRMDRPIRPGLRTRLIYERWSRRVVAIAPAIAEQLRAGGVPAERIAVIPSAVDPARVQPRRDRATVRHTFGAGAEPVILTVSALVARKGLDVLLDAVAALAGRGLLPHVWLAGEGPERQALAARAAALGLDGRVQLLGPVRAVADLLAACDVFVLPSRREGLGVAALEAMAAGRAVVASAVGGLATAVVDQRTGLLVPPGDAAALADALERLLRDPAWRERLAAAGPSRVAEGFLPAQMVAAYEDTYRSVLAGPATG